MDELERGEKAASFQSYSYGLSDAEDITLTNWHATIIGPNGTTFDNRIYSLSIVCGPEYPNSAPVVSFSTMINASFVGPRGEVDLSKLPALGKWAPEHTIESVLKAIIEEMKSRSNRSNKQPAESAVY
ncbi:ubiquitin-conjugating enzyme E2 [Fonticula alba]|uniref:Ubiquitin-conjugating enzyme E2 n=1 Tax=Fonticula alba TaxID=691883 RepID=A0A058ZGZ0_FONAL|nr:ubiquitin-conjugating enzyme E2 [Fonticula alba]KCV72752.1 ubiquitin-conjugating enzyme E2 [Fonticula alba]|eukprot:XP_009492453.1 ubiquitin-conjugating enzyme E2 [Fonticula alba]